MTVEFVDENRAEFGVEPVCAALQVAPSTYWSTKRRPPSERSKRDAKMMPLLLALWQANYSVYGARKLWIAARRSGHDIGRDQVARLMGRLGIRGVQRTKKVRTTRPDPEAARPPDLVERDFTADAPNRLWVADLTHVATWSGVAYVCFITDAHSRRIVGWRAASEPDPVLAHPPIGRLGDGTWPRYCWTSRWSSRIVRISHLHNRGSSRTPTNPPSSPASDTASASTRSAPSPRSDRSGTHMTTPWPRP